MRARIREEEEGKKNRNKGIEERKRKCELWDTKMAATEEDKKRKKTNGSVLEKTFSPFFFLPWKPKLVHHCSLSPRGQRTRWRYYYAGKKRLTKDFYFVFTFGVCNQTSSTHRASASQHLSIRLLVHSLFFKFTWLGWCVRNRFITSYADLFRRNLAEKNWQHLSKFRNEGESHGYLARPLSTKRRKSAGLLSSELVIPNRK